MKTTMNRGTGPLPPGLLDSRKLPDEEFSALWDAICVPDELKDQLLAQAVLNFTLRKKVSRARVPLHGLLLLTGGPGTGKTSLARGLASRVAESLSPLGAFQYIEVEPHGLASAALGKSQRAVTELLGTTIAERATIGPTIVLLDEVETLAGSRARMSLEANPIDVHRATDAVLAQLDHLASTQPNLLFIATSNFPQAIDAAFVSRCDLVARFAVPGGSAVRQILLNTLEELATHYQEVASIRSSSLFDNIVATAVGLDGRQIRKLIISACATTKEIALNPNKLTAEVLLEAAKREQAKRSVAGEGTK